jgi:hypothetical protein
MVLVQMEYDYLFHAAYNHVNLCIHLYFISYVICCHTLIQTLFTILISEPSIHLLPYWPDKFAPESSHKELIFVNKVSRYCISNVHYLLSHSKKN